MKIILFPFARGMRTEQKHPKNYPYWSELVELLKEDNHELIQLGITGEEPLIDDFRVNLSYSELCQLVTDCDTWIGVDSFGQHLGWSLGKKGIAIFGQSDPLIFGHEENINLLKDRKYLREQQFWLWEQCEPNDDAFVSPDVVMMALSKFFATNEMKY